MVPDGVVRSYGKVNLANQTAYSNSNSNNSSSTSSSSSKSKVKRSNTGMSQMAGAGQHQPQQNMMPVAGSCAAFNSGSSLEGGLPSGPRWDIEKTSMAAVPRDFQAGPESLPIKTNASLLANNGGANNNNSNGSQTAISSNHTNNNYQPSAAMYRNPSVVGKRDAMLSGGCGVYSNSSNNNNNNIRNNNNTELTAAAVAAAGVSGLWDSSALLEKSPMAAIPRDYQSGPEHMACSKMAAASGGHSLMRTSSSSSNASSGYHSTSASDKSAAAAAALFAGKYRSHQRASHRLHPYMMTSSMGASFPPLMTPAFPQMQQVSCYNV